MLPAYPFQRPSLLTPPPEYARLRETEPVARVALPSGDPVWLLTRFDDVKRTLLDPRFGRAALTEPGAPQISAVPLPPELMFLTDPPVHTRLRGQVNRGFTQRRSEQLRPRVQEVTDELIDRMLEQGPPADLIDALAYPMPVAVICELVGVAPESREPLRHWTERLLTVDAYPPEEVLAAYQQVIAYFTELIAAKRREPADDLLSMLVTADGDDPLSDTELLVMAMQVLLAGYPTTMVTLSSSVAMLLDHPDQLELLRKDPDLLEPAVEELLRLNPPMDNIEMIRVASEDVELSGTTIRAGEAVIPCVASAHRDPRRFADPERFDITRTGNAHIALGAGPHYCLGAALARIEMQVAIETLVRRFPTLRPAVPESELTWKTGLLGLEMDALPVAW